MVSVNSLKLGCRVLYLKQCASITTSVGYDNSGFDGSTTRKEWDSEPAARCYRRFRVHVQLS